MARTWTTLTIADAAVAKLKALGAKQLAVGAVFTLIAASVFGLAGDFFLLVVLLVPVVAFARRVLRLQSEHDITDKEIRQLLFTFLGGIFPACVLASIVEALLVVPWALVCFYSQRDALDPQLREFLDADKPLDTTNGGTVAPPHAGRFADIIQNLKIEKTFGFYVFLFALSYAIAGLVEEYTKLWLVQSPCCCLQCKCCSQQQKQRRGPCDPRRLLLRRVHHPSHHVVVVLAVVAAALGFSFAENLAYTFVLPSFSERLLSASLRSALSTPLHCLCGAITGMRLARVLTTASVPTASHWKTKAWVLGPSIAVHGTFDFQIFLLSSLISQEAADAHAFIYGYALPAASTLLMLYGGWRLSLNEWNALQAAVAGGKGQYAHLEGDLEAGPDSDDDDKGSDDALPEHAKVASRGGVLLV